MTTYQVTVTRDENLWAAVVDGLPAGVIGATDVERFEDLDIEVRDLIAGLTGTEPDSFDLTWRYLIDGQDVTDAITRFTEAQAAFGDAARARDGARNAALAALAKAGLPPVGHRGCAGGLSPARASAAQGWLGNTRSIRSSRSLSAGPAPTCISSAPVRALRSRDRALPVPLPGGRGREGIPGEDVRLEEVLADVGDELFYDYDYDFGDGWEHVIKLEAVLPRQDAGPRAVCVAGRRGGPAKICKLLAMDETSASCKRPARPGSAGVAEGP